MTAALLAEVEAAGIRLTRKGQRLRVDAPPGVVTPELRQRLVTHKAAILELLRCGPVTCADCRHFTRDQINPRDGIGACALALPPALGDPPLYPRAVRRCGSWHPCGDGE